MKRILAPNVKRIFKNINFVNIFMKVQGGVKKSVYGLPIGINKIRSL